MPIVNYEKVFERTLKWFKEQNISKKNGELVKKFLDKYSVAGISYARRTIFLKHIIYLLRECDDVTKLTDRNAVNAIFSKISNQKSVKEKVISKRKVISRSTFQTIVNVSVAFVTWLNDGVKPVAFKDIKNNKRVKRGLKSSDMITWEDGLKMIKATHDIQLAAILSLQLEGGLRPSEFVDLNFEDVEIKKNGITAIKVYGSKTADSDRTRHLYRATPFLQKWLRKHPLKKLKGPLWVQTQIKAHSNKIEHTRYKYPAIAKRVRELGSKAKINKPLDFYNLRHSAIVMSKVAGLQDSMAMREFGHSTTKMYSEVYGRLAVEDQQRGVERIYGLDKEKRKLEKNVICGVCGTNNSHDTDYCDNCSHPLSAKAIEELKSKEIMNEKRLADLEKNQQKMLQHFKRISLTKLKKN